MTEQNKKDMPADNLGRRKIRNDVIFISALLIVVVLIGVCILLFRKEGDSVRVTVDGKLYGEYSLSEDIRVEIHTGDDGSRLNVLVIKDGKAYVEEASCPDKICKNHRPIYRDGESIACLPHKVAVTVYSKDKSADIVV